MWSERDSIIQRLTSEIDKLEKRGGSAKRIAKLKSYRDDRYAYLVKTGQANIPKNGKPYR